MDVPVRKRYEENMSYASETQPAGSAESLASAYQLSTTVFVVLFSQAKGGLVVFTSASPRCLDLGNVDLLHLHHGIEGAFCLTATRRKRIG